MFTLVDDNYVRLLLNPERRGSSLTMIVYENIHNIKLIAIKNIDIENREV